MKIYIQLPREGIYLDVEPTDTLGSVKQKIQELKGIEIYDQLLSFNGRLLFKDEATLHEMNISERGLRLTIPQIAD